MAIKRELIFYNGFEEAVRRNIPRTITCPHCGEAVPIEFSMGDLYDDVTEYLMERLDKGWIKLKDEL